MNRAARILNAPKSTRAASANEFAALFGVNHRAVAGEVASLQELLSQTASITPVGGYCRLLVAGPLRYQIIRSGLASSTSFSDPTARALFIVVRLFCATQPVRIEELTQEMPVSHTTVVADLNRIREHVGERELEVEGRTHVSLVLRGPELQQYLLILQCRYPTAYDYRPSWQRIERAVAGLIAEAGLNPTHTPELTHWAVVATDRTRQSRLLGVLPAWYRELPGTPVHTLAEHPTLRLTDDGVGLAGDEMTFLVLPIAGMHVLSDSELATGLGNYGEPIEELVGRVLIAIHTKMQIDLTGAPQLTEFTRHPAYMINRTRYRIWVDDSGVAGIGRELLVTYRMATVAARVIEEWTGLPVDGPEFGFLTAYSQMFLEAVDRDPRLPLQIAVIASTDRVTVELVHLQLSRLLPSATQYLLLSSAITKSEPAEVDLVVAIDDHSVSAPALILRVSHILDHRVLARELNRYHMWFPDLDSGIPANAPDKQHFFTSLSDTDYASATGYMAAHLEARGLAEQGFRKRIRGREHLSPTQLDHWAGLLHTTLTARSGVLLAVDVVPREPDEDGVQLVALLGVLQDPHCGESIFISAYNVVLWFDTCRGLLTRISYLATFKESYYFLATNPLMES